METILLAYSLNPIILYHANRYLTHLCSFLQYRVGTDKLNVKSCYRNLSEFQMENFKDSILKNYKYRLFIDNLPSATIVRHPETGEVHTDYFSGIPVGKLIYVVDLGVFKYILYNHWNLVVKTSQVENSLHQRIVGFEVEPRSYAQGQKIEWDIEEHKPLYLDELQLKDKKDQQFGFTYSIITKNDAETAWSYRMEHYLKTGSENIHLAAILLSVTIVITLMFILSSLMKNGLSNDFLNHFKNRMATN